MEKLITSILFLFLIGCSDCKSEETSQTELVNDTYIVKLFCGGGYSPYTYYSSGKPRFLHFGHSYGLNVLQTISFIDIKTKKEIISS